MNRKICFRAWDGARKTWLHQAKTPDMAIHLTGETIMFGELWRRPDGSIVPMSEMNQIIWMQFTGLLDKHGKNIFEDDVVRWTSWSLGSGREADEISKVVWRVGAWRLSDNESWPMAIYDNIEVIGNIWENGDLLKEDTDK